MNKYISQLELVAVIMTEISNQVPGITTNEIDMDGVLTSVNKIVDSTNAKLAESNGQSTTAI